MGRSTINDAMKQWEDTHSGDPRLEQIAIPPGRSLLWRKDDYPWSRSVWNYHPEIEIHLICHSSGLAFLGDHIGRFEAGQLVIVGSNLPHNWITPDLGDTCLPGRDIIVQFDPLPFLQCAALLPELTQIGDLLKRAARGIEFLGGTAAEGRRCLEQMEGVDPSAAMLQLLRLLSLMAGSDEFRYLASQQFVDTHEDRSANDQDQLRRALRYLEDNFLDGPSLGDVAATVGMSETAFSRFFKTRTGNTFTEHVVSLRVWMAQKLLTETQTPITEICYMAGFNNISNFNRTFLAKAAMSPSAYRRAARSRA